ncbi:hypothetical protein GGX14DRAFT_387295 [Mycena pura]|uniref:Uncharacterized protein n=1 Tax=Mycena pura TaxID=153505 RepID=A0AAD6YNL7_9AGAR|nr:hypothetical protein GGX14DRAFT_387295 [Mycena pura]
MLPRILASIFHSLSSIHLCQWMPEANEAIMENMNKHQVAWISATSILQVISFCDDHPHDTHCFKPSEQMSPPASVSALNRVHENPWLVPSAFEAVVRALNPFVAIDLCKSISFSLLSCSPNDATAIYIDNDIVITHGDPGHTAVGGDLVEMSHASTGTHRAPARDAHQLADEHSVVHRGRHADARQRVVEALTRRIVRVRCRWQRWRQIPPRGARCQRARAVGRRSQPDHWRDYQSRALVVMPALSVGDTVSLTNTWRAGIVGDLQRHPETAWLPHSAAEFLSSTSSRTPMLSFCFGLSKYSLVLVLDATVLQPEFRLAHESQSPIVWLAVCKGSPTLRSVHKSLGGA